MEYQLIDSGNLKKLEKFGSYIISRPCAQAIWKPKLQDVWNDADFIFLRDDRNKWINKTNKKESWIIEVDKVKLNLKLTDFGHIGFFPEHLFLCNKMQDLISRRDKKLNILNLFAYTGLASLFAAKNGARVCHVDSSKPTTLWAKENLGINNFKNPEIRFIVDDVMKFLKREEKRESKYDGIILDPPSFGRGINNEVFKIESDIYPLLEICRKLLVDELSFIIFSCHTPGFTKIVLKNFFTDLFKEEKHLEIDELLINSQKGYSLPSGFYVIWKKNEL
ncbi:MAG: class I SAM-dependent methyltransferase [Parachlamydiales bacterium]